LPATRQEFWKAKLDANAETDLKVIRHLIRAGWRVLIVWECSLKGRTRRPSDWVLDRISGWLESGKGHIEIAGKSTKLRASNYGRDE
jgi:DNA mismatch endonuclease (patch repair protein)